MNRSYIGRIMICTARGRHSPSLRGLKYKLVPSENVRNFVLEIARLEWEPDDFGKYGRDLYHSAWKLEEVELGKVRPNQDLLDSPVFQKDLRQRTGKIRRILQDGQPIPPLILRGSDLLIFDGYARYTVFLETGIRNCLAYIGRLG